MSRFLFHILTSIVVGDIFGQEEVVVEKFREAYFQSSTDIEKCFNLHVVAPAVHNVMNGGEGNGGTSGKLVLCPTSFF